MGTILVLAKEGEICDRYLCLLRNEDVRQQLYKQREGRLSTVTDFILEDSLLWQSKR